MSMLASTTSLDIPIGRKSSSSSSSPYSNSNESDERITLMGRSRAGDGTAFCIPQLKLLLDCGVPIQQWTPRHVFLSHTHSDHVHYLTRVNNNAITKSQQQGANIKPPLVLLPAQAVTFVERYLHAHQEMIDCKTMMECKDQESQQSNDGNHGDERGMLELRPTLPGEEVILYGVGDGHRTYYVRTVECHHRIDTLGFSVFLKAKRKPRVLKQEYIGLPGKEIGRLIKQGQVDVFMPAAAAASSSTTEDQQDDEDEAVFCFLGDTTHHVFEMHPEILSQHSIIIVECSFIDEKDLPRAAKTKHMHWNNLRPFVDAHPDILFVLIHFSLKYSSLELRRFFCKVSSRHQNIHPMLLQQEVEADWNKSSSGNSSSSQGKDKRRRRQQKENAAPPVCNCRICTSSDSAHGKT